MRNWRGGTTGDRIRQPFGLTPSPCAGKASPSVTGAGAGDTSPGGGGKAGRVPVPGYMVTQAGSA